MNGNNGIRVLAWWKDAGKYYQFVTQNDYYALRYQYEPIELSERGEETNWMYTGTWIATGGHGDTGIDQINK